MVVIGLAIWLVLAGYYTGLVVCACAAFVVSALRHGTVPWTRAFFALWIALLLAPSGCIALHFPMNFEGLLEVVGEKPRYLDSLELSYALPFVGAFGVAWLVFPRARRPIKAAGA